MRFHEKVSLILVLSSLKQTKLVSGSNGENTSSENESERVKRTFNADGVSHPPIAITLRPQIQGTKVRTKRALTRDDAGVLKTFNFPEIEYPTASTPRPPFHLQKTNILQRNPVEWGPEFPTATNVHYPTSKYKKDMQKGKYNALPHFKSTRAPEISVTYSGFGATPKPYCFREEGNFPDVEYPLDAKDTWNPNYWKPMPGTRFKNEINNKNGPENSSKFRSKVKAGVGSSKSAYSKKSNSNKNKKQDSFSSASLANELHDKYDQVSKKQEDPEKNEYVEIDNHKTMTTDMNQTPKSPEQQTTPAPMQSISTKSTTPFVLTPYTTLYFDTTSEKEANSSNDDNKSTTPYPKKTEVKQKKKKIKPKCGSSRLKSKIQNKSSSFTQIPLTTPMPKYQIDFDESEDLDLSHRTTPSPPEKILLTTQYEITGLSDKPNPKINSSESDTCPYSVRDPLSTMSTTPIYLSSDVTPNDEKWLTISSDKNIASLSDACNKIDEYRFNKELSCFDDNVVSSNKTSICYDKIVNPTSLLDNVVPSLDEEFSTDVIPDFDENSPLNLEGSSTTVSLPSIGWIDESWEKSRVIEDSESGVYSDELEKYYIMVP